LNEKALSVDKEKYGYTKQILRENMQKNINKDIIDLFINALNNIEIIHNDSNYLENEVNNIEAKISEISNL